MPFLFLIEIRENWDGFKTKIIISEMGLADVV